MWGRLWCLWVGPWAGGWGLSGRPGPNKKIYYIGLLCLFTLLFGCWGAFYTIKEWWEAWAHTLEGDMMVHTLQSVPRKCPHRAMILGILRNRFLLFSTCHVRILYSWKYLKEYLKHNLDFWIKSTTLLQLQQQSNKCKWNMKLKPQFPLMSGNKVWSF